MKRILALMFIAAPALANIADSTYSVIPPASDFQCPANQPGQAYPCYYVALGAFTDTYRFTVANAVDYSFEVTGRHWRKCTVSGRGTACYTESMTITDATVVDINSGAVVLQLDYTAVDDWTGAASLLPGDYALRISGIVAGNKPGIYGYDIYEPTATIIVDDPTPIIVD